MQVFTCGPHFSPSSGKTRFTDHITVKKCGLERKLDSGKDAAGAGFLPGEIDAVDDGECGNHSDNPKNRPHAIEEPADDEQHDALGALHKADLTQGNEGLSAGAR